MAHYAYINDENVVTSVIVGPDENSLADGISSWEDYFSSKGKGRALRTSYNTLGNAHLSGGVPFRGNYAVAGGTYDENLDVFISPKPYKAWELNQETFLWEPPIPYPEDDGGVEHSWDDELDNWIPIV